MNRITIEKNLERFVRFLFFWENEKGIGIYTRWVHHSVLYMSLLLYAVHLFIPSSLLFFVLYGFFGIIWLQHSFLGSCIFTNVELKLIGNKKSFIRPMLDVLDMKDNDNISFVLSTIMLCVLSVELVIRNVFS